jgi:predicted TIM-barrel fold metal-dependent hydrolase
MHDGHRIVDSDGHLLEPADVFDGRVDPRHLERAPRILRDAEGRQGMSFDGTPPYTGGVFGLGDAVTPQGLRAPQGRQWDEAQPGGFDPHQRIRDMDIEGIDAAVLFPTLGLFLPLVPDGEAMAAIARCLNDHAVDYCRPYPDRLFPVALLPLKDVDAAVAELQRVAALGFVGVTVRPNPDPHTQRKLDDPAYEPLWSAAEEAGLVVAVHEGVNPLISFAGIDRCQTMFDWHCVSHPFEQMLAMMTLVRAGVMERHPQLRFGFMESNCGWLPYWLERLDSNWHNLSWQVPEIRRPPSEYFKRQCAITCEADEEAVGAVVSLVGDDRIMWASDYPHYDAEFPGAVAEMFSRPSLSDAVRSKVMAGNADTFFRLPVSVAAK